MFLHVLGMAFMFAVYNLDLHHSSGSTSCSNAHTNRRLEQFENTSFILTDDLEL